MLLQRGKDGECANSHAGPTAELKDYLGYLILVANSITSGAYSTELNYNVDIPVPRLTLYSGSLQGSF